MRVKVSCEGVGMRVKMTKVAIFGFSRLRQANEVESDANCRNQRIKQGIFSLQIENFHLIR